MSKPKRFILNDDSVQNSYGFFILTAGGKLDRFKKNPVMLSDHINRNENVIGNWLNLEVKDGIIDAEPNFDVARPIGLEISGQVEREFIKGASMGILPNWDSMERVGDRLVLKEWELVEASIVPVPSNRNSIAIYNIDGKLMEESEIQTLCLSFSENNPEIKINPENNMKKIILSVGALLALGYDNAPADGLDVAEVEAKILGLSATNKTLKEKNEKLELAAQTAKEAAETAKKEAVTKKVDLAISQGKFKADQKDSMANLGIANEEALDTAIGAIPAKTNLGADIKVPGANGATEVKTMDDFQKLSLEQQMAFKADFPTEYQKILG